MRWPKGPLHITQPFFCLFWGYVFFSVFVICFNLSRVFVCCCCCCGLPCSLIPETLKSAPEPGLFSRTDFSHFGFCLRSILALLSLVFLFLPVLLLIFLRVIVSSSCFASGFSSPPPSACYCHCHICDCSCCFCVVICVMLLRLFVHLVVVGLLFLLLGCSCSFGALLEDRVS